MMSEPLNFKKMESDVGFTARTTYKVPLTYEDIVETIRTSVSLLHTRAGANLLYPSLIPTDWKHRIRRHDRPRLHSTTRQPLHLDELILLHLRLGDL